MTENSMVTRQLAALRRMDIHELREKYAELYGYETSAVNMAMLRKRLAYRIQEIYFGGLTTAEKAILESIANKDAKAKLEKVKPQRGIIIEGTRFSREWHGRVYETVVTAEGKFEYDGRLFRSLSAVAKEITGTQWNGKAFFGIKEWTHG